MRKTRQSFQLTYLDWAGESPRRQPPKDGIHPEKVPGKEDNPHFFCPSIPSESMEKHQKGDCVLARVKEAHGRQNKKEKRRKNGQRRKINCVQQFLFHGGVVGFVPPPACVWLDAQRRAISPATHVKTGGEKEEEDRGKLGSMTSELENSLHGWTGHARPDSLSLSLPLALSLPLRLSLSPSPPLSLSHTLFTSRYMSAVFTFLSPNGMAIAYWSAPSGHCGEKGKT